MSAPTAGAWFVLHTRSRQEKVVAADLEARKTHCYLPTVEAVRYYGRRKQKVTLPLFPGYVFMHGQIEQAYAIDRHRGLVQVLKVPDQQPLTENLCAIQAASAAGAVLDPHPYLVAGVCVEVTAGPFKGISGVIENRRRPDRLILQVDVLGQATSLEIDGSLLRPIESAEMAGV